MKDKIEVYIKINEKKEVVQVGSSVFIEDFENWIKIDEGVGDKYAHAQNQYLNEPIINSEGKYNFIFENHKIIKK